MMAAFLFVFVAFAATRTGASGGPHYVPPDITAASDIPYPINNIASGLVSVSVNLTAGGQVQSVQVVRDIPGLTPGVTNAVNTWRFTLASSMAKEFHPQSMSELLSTPALFEARICRCSQGRLRYRRIRRDTCRRRCRGRTPYPQIAWRRGPSCLTC